MTAEDVVAMFATFGLTPGEAEYLQGQAKRVAYLTDLIQKYCEERGEASHLLDVGPHFLTRCLLESITPRPIMSTIGYEFPKLMPPDMVHEHATIDLNEIGSLPLPFEPESFDIVVICEVVEHLFIPPDVVLSYLMKLLKRPGGIIVLGTPNAVSLAHRLRMMLGENPFHPLNPNWRSGLGHIREYTMQELRSYGEAANLRVVFEEYCDYWEQGMYIEQIASLERDIPSYRTGLTVVYQP
ncbi:MAG: methyltransferase domain-containing protein [Acetobacteraceae bacterium]